MCRFGCAVCIQRLIAANIPPATSSIDSDLFPSIADCSTPDINMPNMRAKPFRTFPACLITSPTHIPPALFVNIGTRVNIVHSSKNPRSRICLPSSLVTNDADSRRREAMHNSTVKKRALRFITCRLFWVIAPARPERKDATKMGNTPCEKCRGEGGVFATFAVVVASFSGGVFIKYEGNIGNTPSITNAAVNNNNSASICTIDCLLFNIK